MSIPSVSVVLPVYNGETFIRNAIGSILNQSFTDFELIIVNDGSTDNSEEMILSFQDNRIQYYKNKINLGLVSSLNLGLSLAKGKYIARMDADDISFPNRLDLQYNYLESNPEIGVCGAYMKVMGQSDLIKCPIEHLEIFFDLLIKNVIAHPVVMIRKEVLEKNQLLYEEEYFPAEDYMLWVKCSKYCKFHNLPIPLLEYNIHEGSISVSKKEIQIRMMHKVRAFHLLEALHFNTAEHLLIIEKAFSFSFEQDLDFIFSLKKALTDIVRSNNFSKTFGKRRLNNLLAMYWYVCCKLAIKKRTISLGFYDTTIPDLKRYTYKLKLFLFNLLNIHKIEST